MARMSCAASLVVTSQVPCVKNILHPQAALKPWLLERDMRKFVTAQRGSLLQMRFCGLVSQAMHKRC